MAPTRWGFVSAGRISNEFKIALDTLPQDEHQVKIDFESINAVYIGSIHTQHAPVTTMMLQAGKPVLCEKPMSVNSREARQMIGLAKEKNLFFMEAVWSRFFPVYLKAREIMDAGGIGEVKLVTACFGFPKSDEPRMKERSQAGGSLMDLGVYPVQFANFVFKGEEPEDITVSGNLTDGEVDETVSIILKYSGNRMATLVCCMTSQLANEAYVYGTKGTLKIPSFWSPQERIAPDSTHNPQELIAPDGTHKFPLPPPGKPINYFNATGMRFEAMEVRRCLQEGLTESPLMTHAMSLQIAGILDQARKVVGVVYDQDKE
uniref:Trans-1,2-dihydrobenzene-1,2-diol dehydrogenase n=1 Tax=Branchiostoma floridae TaxID=7739 RepID=C3YUR0_BRAFL|eukprot:XP_002599949.1 hypothetical protein BRAFLDRAFT_58119 [Branchiostoma floridae]